MQTKLLITLLLTAAPALLHAQGGSLTPPAGPIEPTMKSLDIIEARIPLVAGAPGVTVNGTTGAITITAPGSYYLTRNLTITTASTHGITINAHPVTVDLNGHSLICTSVSGGNAIQSSVTGAVTVRNGHIRGGTTVSGSTFTLNGWNNGVLLQSSVHALVENLNVSGVRATGISAASNSSQVRSCSVDIAGEIGVIAPMVIDTTSRRCQSDGIWVGSTSSGNYLISNCIGESVGSSGVKYGIDANAASSSSTAAVVQNSVGSAVSGIGIRASVVTNCSGKGSSMGIQANNVTNSYGVGTVGISCNTASFCRAFATAGGDAISANIAIGCTTAGGTIDSPQKHLGTP